MIPIILLAWKRPDDLRECLEHLAKVRGIEDCVLLPHIEPGCDETRSLIEGISFCESRPTWNDQVLGTIANAANAHDLAFKLADFIVYTEEDILFSPDALDYFKQCNRVYRRHPKVGSVTGYNRLDDMPDPKDWHRCGARHWYHCWGSGMWRDRYAAIRSSIVNRGGRDTQINDYWIANGLYEVYPVLSRSQNIGEITTCQDPNAFPPEWYRVHHRLKHWAGDVDVHDGLWSCPRVELPTRVAKRGCNCGQDRPRLSGSR